MADPTAAERPNVTATFNHNDHCTSEGWATWADFVEGSGLRAWWHRRHGRHEWAYKEAYPGYRRCDCGRAEQWYSVDRHRFGSYDRPVWEAAMFSGITERLDADRG